MHEMSLITYQCHLIATHPARNLSLCHILGAFVQNNFEVIEMKYLSPMYIVDPPGLFDISFFTRTNAIYIREGVPHFYAMGEAAIPAGRIEAGPGGQAQEQRNVELEKAIAEMVEENRETRSQVTRLANLMEDFFKQFIQATEAHGAGTSRQGSQDTHVPEQEEGSDDNTDEEGDDDNQDPADRPQEQPTRGPPVRRSQRNK